MDMNFTIATIIDNGPMIEPLTKEELLKYISNMIDNCIANGGTDFDIYIEANASCFSKDETAKFSKLQVWQDMYIDNDVCMTHLLSSEEANELTAEEKMELLEWAGEEDSINYL